MFDGIVVKLIENLFFNVDRKHGCCVIGLVIEQVCPLHFPLRVPRRLVPCEILTISVTLKLGVSNSQHKDRS